MMLIKIILKILAVPVMILCKLIRFLIDMAAKISCLVLGPITLFVLGCAIYTIVKHNWSQTIILILIEATCFTALIGAGVVSTGIGSFGDWLGEYIRS
jgi:hypothetical protein